MYKVFANLDLVASFLWKQDAREYIELMEKRYPENRYILEGE